MPGLVGVMGDMPANELDRLLKDMAQALKHEDWYQVHLYADEGVGLGRVSLGILNREPQPIWNEDDRVCIVMEGEVYDYEDEKRRLIERGHRFQANNDPEFVLHLYEEYGEDFALKLNGTFVAAIWDTAKHRLLIANDRFGLRPLYYTHHNGRLLFAAGARAILADRTFKPGVDAATVAQLFTFRHALGDRTLCEGIHLLPPASLLLYENEEDALTVSRYWDFQYVEEYLDQSEEDYVDQWIHYMRRAVERRMRGDLPIGVQLSGGIDSRTVLAMIDRQHYPVQTFTFGVPRNHDALFAREVAQKLGTEHHFFELKPDYLLSFVREGIRLTDGLHNCVHMHCAGTLGQIVEHVRLLYTGNLGDSLMGGTLYRTLLGVHKADVLEQILFRKANGLIPVSGLPQFFSDGFYQTIKDVPFESFRTALAESKATLSTNRHDHFRIRELERRFILNGPRLLRSQVVCRTPFYDNDLVDFMLRVPPALRLDRYLYFRAFAQAFPSLAKIPCTSFNLLPLTSCRRELITRAKNQMRWRLRAAGLRWVAPPGQRWYANYADWMRTTLRDLVEDTLLDGTMAERGYFNSTYVRNMIEEHMSGRADRAERIGALLTFELWHRMFID